MAVKTTNNAASTTNAAPVATTPSGTAATAYRCQRPLTFWAAAAAIKATDGFSATYVVNSSTKVHVKGGSTSISGVVVNDRVLAAGVASGSTVTAARIIDAGPKK